MHLGAQRSCIFRAGKNPLNIDSEAREFAVAA